MATILAVGSLPVLSSLMWTCTRSSSWPAALDVPWWSVKCGSCVETCWNYQITDKFVGEPIHNKPRLATRDTVYQYLIVLPSLVCRQVSCSWNHSPLIGSIHFAEKLQRLWVSPAKQASNELKGLLGLHAGLHISQRHEGDVRKLDWSCVSMYIYRLYSNSVS